MSVCFICTFARFHELFSVCPCVRLSVRHTYWIDPVSVRLRYLYVRLILSPDICPSSRGCDSPYGMLFIARDDVLLMILAYCTSTVPYHALVINQSARSMRTVSYRTCRKSCQCSYKTRSNIVPYSIEHDMSAVLNTRTLTD